jgi:hypothetical protein
MNGKNNRGIHRATSMSPATKPTKPTKTPAVVRRATLIAPHFSQVTASDSSSAAQNGHSIIF